MKLRKLFPLGYIVFCICIMAPYQAESAILYKTYVIKYDRGWDILCEPYIVQKNDWVFKLFRQKGEISHKHFPEFINIFKRINPDVRNINMIRPGQRIFIPLKKINKDILPGQSSGVVTIPFVNISKVPDMIKPYSTEYRIQKGDNISQLIAKRYGLYGTKSYKEGIELLKLINPTLADLDRIYAGEKLYMPNSYIQNMSWYRTLFDSSGTLIKNGRLNTPVAPGIIASQQIASRDNGSNTVSPYSQVASVLGAKLLNKGMYYFPGHGEEDLALDLSKVPVIECKDGTRIIFPGDNMKATALNAVKPYWRKVKIVPLITETSVANLFDAVFKVFEKNSFKKRLSFSDRGVEVETRGKWIVDRHSTTGGEASHVCITLIQKPNERTPDSIIRYLEQHNIIIKDILLGNKGAGHEAITEVEKNRAVDAINIFSSDRKTFVKDLMVAMDYDYAQNVGITFPYAGIQIEASSNLITAGDGNPLLVDFGALYGDAVQAIEKTGLNIIQITDNDDKKTIMRKILRASGVSYINNPTFVAAKRPVILNTSFTIPGFLLSNNQAHETFLPVVPLHNGVIELLEEKGIKVILSVHDEQD